MNAKQVMALVAAKFPGVLESPLAQAMHGASAMAQLESSDADAVIRRADMLLEAKAHANACLWARDGWTVETLSHNIESSVPDLDIEDCDAVAEGALSACSEWRA